MAKVTAPLLSFGARGQIGKSAVFATWKGVNYARQHVVPANPQTVAQQANRALFAFLREMWKRAPAGLQAPWTAFAAGKKFTNFNKFIGENQRLIGSDADLDNFEASPGALGGLPPDAAVSAAPGAAGTFQVTVTAPTAPDGWTLVGASCVAIPQQDPHGLFNDVITYSEDLITPYVVLFAGLTAGATYVWSTWLVWTKPDGTTAYSASVTGTQAAHA